MEFKFYRFNPHRRARGARAVQIRVLEDGEDVGLVWMSRADINDNIREHGMCDAFNRGLKCYQTGEDPGENSLCHTQN